MEDVPWPSVDVPSCLSQNRRDVEKCAVPRVATAPTSTRHW